MAPCSYGKQKDAQGYFLISLILISKNLTENVSGLYISHFSKNMKPTFFKKYFNLPFSLRWVFILFLVVKSMFIQNQFKKLNLLGHLPYHKNVSAVA